MERGLNDIVLVEDVVRQLRVAGLSPLLFGGWAMELLGLEAPRPHADIDLLLPAPSFEELDRLMADKRSDGWREIKAKRFHHKRAFAFRDVMVEVFLVEQGNRTLFWGDVPFQWLDPLAHDTRVQTGSLALSIVSPANLLMYREQHPMTEP